MKNEILSYTKSEEKDGSGHLLPEVRARVMGEIENYIRNTGYINYSFLSEKLGLTKLTVRSIVSEITEEWKKYNSFDIHFEIQWLKHLLVEIEEQPDKFDSKKIALIAFKIGIYDKINGLKRLMTSDNSVSFIKEEINFNIFKQVKPKTLELLRQKQESQNQQGVQ